MAPDKWKGAGRDFLIGDADQFQGIPAPDLAQVRAVLDHAQAAGVEVVITMLSLPGARWRQHNGNRSDFRLYREPRFAEQAAAFWRELATALRGHPALVGYNPINEPHPELATGPVDEDRFDFPAFARRAEGTLEDLNGLYARIVSAIRLADPDTPIVLDAGLYATPPAIAALRPLADPHVLYSVHMYEPFVYTNASATAGGSPTRARFPSTPTMRSRRGVVGTRTRLARFLDPVLTWQRAHGLPAERILVGEFGVDRRARGADRYLTDLVDVFEDARLAPRLLRVPRGHLGRHGLRDRPAWPARRLLEGGRGGTTRGASPRRQPALASHPPRPRGADASVVALAPQRGRRVVPK